MGRTAKGPYFAYVVGISIISFGTSFTIVNGVSGAIEALLEAESAILDPDHASPPSTAV